MTLDEFRRHPAYDYYIITLVSDCLVCDLETKFDNQYTIILSKKLWNKYVEVERKYKTDTDKMTASDYTHLFGYLNPYYRTAYSIPKRKR
jgi:hypothetical protein